MEQEGLAGVAGRALLVDTFAPGERDAARCLANLGEVLLASGAFSSVRRLSPEGSRAQQPTRAALKSGIAWSLEAGGGPVVLAFRTHAFQRDQQWALTVGDDWRHYPDDDSLDLRWITDALRDASNESLVVLLEVSGGPGGEIAAALRRHLAPAGAHLWAVGSGAGEASLLRAAVAGLRGGAVDRSGAVTLRSLAAYLDQALPQQQFSAGRGESTILFPPSPFGLWESQPARGHRADPAAEAPADLSGAMLPGRVELERPIAEGSFGTIYLGRQLTIDRPVAVKVLHTAGDHDATRLQLFVSEVRAVGAIGHPNVVTIFQADMMPDGRPFYVMELLRGRDLKALLEDEGPVDAERAVAITSGVLAGLGAVHDAGIVHSDIKPANVFVTDSGEERAVLVDFGLARLWSTGETAQSVGGTPSYMAPEQLYEGKVDQRSDLYAVGLLLYSLLTGERPMGAPVETMLEAVDDPSVRAILARALAERPGDRFDDVREFSAALGAPMTEPATAIDRAPAFRYLSPFAENDAHRFWGRQQDIESVVDRLLAHGALIYTAPSGVGKTSLLRAGMIPRLRRFGFETFYVACKTTGELERALERCRDKTGRLAVIIDQVEALFSRGGDTDEARAHLAELLEATGREVLVLVAVREDFLARVIDLRGPSGGQLPVERLAPLDRAGARAAILGPLEANRLEIEPELLAELLDDLEAEAKSLAPRMGWTQPHAVYPPHLQLVCSVLIDGLGRDETVLSMKRYRETGGLGELVAEHFDRIVDAEFPGPAADVPRALFLELISPADTRLARPEDELCAALSRVAGAADVRAILEVLRRRGLVVPIALEHSRAWELVHDRLVPSVLAWVGRRDLGRRRALELIRYHLRRSADSISLLDRDELRDIDRHPDVVDELTAEADALAAGEVTAQQLVARSRRAIRRRRLSLSAALAIVSAAIGLLVWSCEVDRRAAEREASLRAANIGAFRLVLAPFDWDAEGQSATPVSQSELPDLEWSLYDPSPDDRELVGAEVRDVEREILEVSGSELAFRVEARGGLAFLRVRHRGRRGETCPDSWIRLRWLPGYVDREKNLETVRVVVPTCEATRAGTVVIPAGPYISGGPGVPPTSFPDYVRPRAVIEVPAFRIDRTEVTNAAYYHYASMAAATGRGRPSYPSRGSLRGAADPPFPVSNIDLFEARDYCRFLGKRLPTDREWEKAARGGLYLDAGHERPNPFPARNLPWGEGDWRTRANLLSDADGFSHTAPVGQFPDGASPYGLLDMAGNVHEWIADRSREQGGGHHIVRGGSFELSADVEAHTIAYINSRDRGYRGFETGVRCVTDL